MNTNVKHRFSYNNVNEGAKEESFCSEDVNTEETITTESSESITTTSQSSETASDIFYIYAPEKNSVLYSETNAKSAGDGSGSRPKPYVKHDNLDTKKLNFRQRLRLSRVHFMQKSNLIRILFILFCLGWFVYNATVVLKQFLVFDTIVYMEYLSPNSTNPPAITICIDAPYVIFVRNCTLFI